MALVEIETVVIHQFHVNIFIHDLSLWDEIERFWQMHRFLKYNCVRLFCLQLISQPNTSISEWKQRDLVVSLPLHWLQRLFGIFDDHWLRAGDVGHSSAIDKPITGWSIAASHHPIVLNRSGESQSSLSWCFCWRICYSVGSNQRITILRTQAVVSDLPSRLAMKEPLLILLYHVICIISLIPLPTFAAFTTFATPPWKEENFLTQCSLRLDSSFLADELGDNLIRGWELLHCFCPSWDTEYFPPIISVDPARSGWWSPAYTSWQYSLQYSNWWHQCQRSMAFHRNWSASLSNRSRIGTCQHLRCCIPCYSDGCV